MRRVSRKTGRSRPHRQPPAAERGRPQAATRRPPAAPPPRVAPWLDPKRLAKWLVWGSATFVFFYYTAVGLERQITWYLAVDQFGYLTFANDLLHGRVFHEWAPLKAFEPFFPPRTDVLAQTYVYDGGRLYCRYSPGFPMLLAGWIGLFGNERAHYLNPTVYLCLLAITLAFQWRLFRSPWRAAAGTALIALFPTMMHLWGLTLTRDLSAHLVAFIGLFLLLPVGSAPLRPRRLLAAGLAFGFAVSIRPDAVLYLVPALSMAAVRWVHERRRHARGGMGLAALALAGGVFVGSSPILAYNWAATGNPLLPTQGMELPLLPKLPPPKWKPRLRYETRPEPPPAATDDTVGYPSRGWRGGTFEEVQGGGLRLRNLATTLPGNWRLTLRAYTPLLFGVAVWGAVVASVLRPVLAAAAVSYGVLAFLFFSCWPRPDFRYLIGVFVFIPMLVVEGTMGTLDLIRLLWKQHKPELARGLALFAAAVFLLGALTLRPAPGAGAVSTQLFLVVTLTAGVAAALAAIQPARRVAAVAAPVLMLALIWCKVSDVNAQAGRRAPFQRAQMLEARANMKRLLDPDAVVITTEEVGRPAENIEFYSGVANALYMTDLERWKVPPYYAALYLIFNGKRPYLYVPANQPDKANLLADLRDKGMTVDLVADIPAQQAMAHFVAAPFHRGVRMELYRLSSPKVEEGLHVLPKREPAAN
jgi:hypothetical protein